MTSDHELEALLSRLDALLSRTGRGGDAIDDVLKSAPRTTVTTSLREHEVVRKFRQEMADGLIRLDTANQLLRLASTVLDLAVLP